MKKILTLSLAFLCLSYSAWSQQNYYQWVNPMIGTGGHGHTFPGPTLPFGMVQVGPDTRIDGSWDGCSGYHYNDTFIYGFSHNHLSGTGCSDLGDVMLMPVAGKPQFSPMAYGSGYDHEDENAQAGYYKVKLKRWNIITELTATRRTALHRYTFPAKGEYNIVLDLKHRDKLLDGYVKKIDNNTILGYRKSAAWGKEQIVYFRIVFSKPFTGDINDENAKAFAYTFKLKKGEQLLVKVSLSSTGEEGATANMNAEQSGFDFDGVLAAARTEWNKELSKIETVGGSTDQRTIFYTALYHAFIHPSIYNDIDGKYLGRDGKIHTCENGHNYYTIFSIWDTFRALHPLFNLVQRQRNADFIRTFLLQYQHSGRMPMWELWANETDCMIGYHSLSVIADALAKGNTDFDLSLAKEAAYATANYNHYGVPVFRSKGYLSTEDEHESVSKSLEYAYDDWCLEQILNTKSQAADAGKYPPIPGKLSWQQVFNPANGFMQGRSNGGWYTPFEPREVNNNYTEANAWQYTFFVPQNIPGLIQAMGGTGGFKSKLDLLFSENSETEGRQQADISGLIGQYAHGNEPSHHMAYLYNYINKPGKSKERIQQILHDMYQNAPDGLAGNEDCGQMSAWYVFSAMGFYPVTPGINEYQEGAGIFETVTIHSNEDIVINNWIEPNNSLPTSKVVKGSLNIVSGISGVASEADLSFLPSPVLNAPQRVFTDSMLITVSLNSESIQPFAKYPVNMRILSDSGILIKSFIYSKPFYVNKTCKVEAKVEFAYNGKTINLFSQGKYFKKPNYWKVDLQTTYSKQYTAGGAGALIDGMYGDADWRKGGWQGYDGKDVVAIIQLDKETEIREFYASALQDQGAWIVFPAAVEFYTSTDNITYTLQGSVKNTFEWNTTHALTQTFRLQANQKIKAKYVKVIVKNSGALPKGHLSEGEKSWTFIDEIGVR